MRKYVQPAVESEEMLEQTSLACNVTALNDRTPDCARLYRKSEAYFNNVTLQCATVLLQAECMVALS
jgi:hypothetical protein